MPPDDILPDTPLDLHPTHWILPGTLADIVRVGVVAVEITPQGEAVLPLPGPRGVQGIQGPVGPMGPSGPSRLSYSFVQSEPAVIWNIDHGLGRYPSVTLVDSSGDVVWSDVRHIDINTLQVVNASAFSGTALLL